MLRCRSLHRTRARQIRSEQKLIIHHHLISSMRNYYSVVFHLDHSSVPFVSYVSLLEKEVARLRNDLFACATRVTSRAKDETFSEKDLQNNPLAGQQAVTFVAIHTCYLPASSLPSVSDLHSHNFVSGLRSSCDGTCDHGWSEEDHWAYAGAGRSASQGDCPVGGCVDFN